MEHLPAGLTRITWDAAPDRRVTMTTRTEDAPALLTADLRTAWSKILRTYPQGSDLR